MTGLIRRALTLVRAWWRRASTAVLRRGGGIVRVARTASVRLVGYAATVLAAIRDRHRDRMSHDPAYRTALATGLSALLVTVTPQPAVAAALAVLVSEHLGSTHPSQESVYYGFHDEQDGHGGYDARRSWSSPPSRPTQRRWERYSD